jgi:hypothetical protein
MSIAARAAAGGVAQRLHDRRAEEPMEPNCPGVATLRVGGRLSDLAARDALLWRPQYTRDAVVLAVLHDAACAPCADYARELGKARSAFASWDGRVIIARPDVPGEPAEPGGPQEPGGPAEPAHGVPTIPDRFGGAPRIIVADRFGDIFHVDDGGTGHRLPEPRALEDWLRFLATQCPE